MNVLIGIARTCLLSPSIYADFCYIEPASGLTDVSIFLLPILNIPNPSSRRILLLAPKNPQWKGKILEIIAKRIFFITFGLLLKQ
jgi:hypothetical protein